MNIIEAYIKFKQQLIIIISGISGCNKTSLAKKLSKELGLKLINQNDYLNPDYNVIVMLPNDTKIINWHNDDAVLWDKFNDDIINSTGAIVSGFSFPVDKLKFIPDYHIHITITKQSCIKKRQEFLKKHKDDPKYVTEFNEIGTPIENYKFNQLAYPYYMESVKNMKVNKFINANKLSNDEIINDAWNSIISFVQKYIDSFNETQYWNWKESKENNETKP